MYANKLAVPLVQPHLFTFVLKAMLEYLQWIEPIFARNRKFNGMEYRMALCHFDCAKAIQFLVSSLAIHDNSPALYPNEFLISFIHIVKETWRVYRLFCEMHDLAGKSIYYHCLS